MGFPPLPPKGNPPGGKGPPAKKLPLPPPPIVKKLPPPPPVAKKLPPPAKVVGPPVGKNIPPPVAKLPPPLPPRPAAQGANLKKANQNTPVACGKAGATVLPCKWNLTVSVHSQEKFWPGADFDVKLHNLAPDGSLAAVDRTSSLKMLSPDSPKASFDGSGPKAYGVTATVYNLNKEADWLLTSGKGSTVALPKKAVTVNLSNGNNKHVDLYARHPLLVYLQLKFKDPEDRELTFPADFPVKVLHGANEVASLKTAAEGKLEFELDRKYDWFTLLFGDQPAFISNGDGKGTTSELKTAADQKQLNLSGHKYFSPPDTFSLLQSIWKLGADVKFISGEDAYVAKEAKFYVYKDAGKKWVRRIGEKGAHLPMVLDPHWQYVRFEYFDRYYGHSDHGHRRVSIPAVPVEGHYNAKREGTGHWLIHPDSVDTATLCVPWVLQKDKTGVEEKRPVAKCALKFATDANTFSSATDANTRKIEILDAVKDAARLEPSADRMKLYDLPPSWKSANYYARYVDGGKNAGKFYQDLTDDIVAKSRSAKTPLLFSLDDMVITDETGAPLKLAKDDRFAAFYHTFKPAYDQGKGAVSPPGVWKPDAGNKQTFYSQAKLEGPDYNYWTEYPNWVRLVAGLSNLYDVFGQRTKGDIQGARAAVRWLDLAPAGWAQGKSVSPRPATSYYPDNAAKFFCISPLYEQRYSHTWQQYTGAAAPTIGIGRFGLVLLRCCDRDGASEKFVVFNFFRFCYHFGTPPVISNVKVATVKGALQVTWDTDTTSETRFYYGTDPARLQEHKNLALIKNHSVDWPLGEGNVGYVRLGSSSAKGTGYLGDFKVMQAPKSPTLPPGISNVQVGYTRTHASVKWTSAALGANTGGQYSAGGKFNDLPAPALSGGAWVANIDALTKNTEVAFKLWTQAGAVKAWWEGFKFTTQGGILPVAERTSKFDAPSFSDLQYPEVKDSSAKVQWKTSVVGSTNLEWSQDASFSNALGAGNADTHKVEIKGLAPYEFYNYRLRTKAGAISASVGNFKFNTVGPENPTPSKPNPYHDSPYHKKGVDVGANRKQFADLASLAIVNRWNGDDGINTTRTQLLPVKGDRLKGDVSYFIMPVEKKAEAHFSLDVVGGDGRNWMSGSRGTGEIGEEGSQAESQYCKDSYTAAHEFGHGSSQPDEYPENGSQYSYNFEPIRCNLPGDPFSNDQWGMMYFAYKMRNRYFWHQAEFAHQGTGEDFKVKHENYADYRLPRHPGFPERSYTYWPVGEKLDAASGAHGKYDVLLYAAGPDRYTNSVAPKGPYDGILVLMVKMRVTLHTNDVTTIRRILAAMLGAVTSYSRQFYASGTVPVKTDKGTEDRTFNKCLFTFSPRVHVSNNNVGSADYDQLDADIPLHFDVVIQNAKKGASAFGGGAPKILTLVQDFSKANAEANLAVEFKDYFAKMIGLADAAAVTAPNLSPIAQLVITKKGAVNKL